MNFDPRFSKFDRLELERGLLDMRNNPEYSEELKQAIRNEILYRIENPDYERECRAKKALTGGYDLG